MRAARVEWRLAARRGADRPDELVRLGVLEEVAARAGVKRREHLLTV